MWDVMNERERERYSESESESLFDERERERWVHQLITSPIKWAGPVSGKWKLREFLNWENSLKKISKTREWQLIYSINK